MFLPHLHEPLPLCGGHERDEGVAAVPVAVGRVAGGQLAVAAEEKEGLKLIGSYNSQPVVELWKWNNQAVMKFRKGNSKTVIKL